MLHFIPVCARSTVSERSLTISPGSVNIEERVDLLQQRGVTIWLTGLSASGKVGLRVTACIILSNILQSLTLAVYDRVCSRATFTPSAQIHV
jgi:hypothetical protein